MHDAHQIVRFFWWAFFIYFKKGDTMETVKIFHIDRFKGMDGFINMMNHQAFDKFKWNGNLDSLNDLIINEGFGNNIEGKIISIVCPSEFKQELGKYETIKWITKRIENLKAEHELTHLNQWLHYVEDNRRHEYLYWKIAEIIQDNNDKLLGTYDLLDEK